MATEQRIGRSSSRLTALKNIISLIPAVVVMAVTLNTLSCGHTGGLLTLNGSGGGGGSGSATGSASGTPTPTGALAFVTNFNDGMVSSFTRNTKTGVLKRTGQTMAGVKKGPRGVVASPSGSFLYVANIGDDNIYEFSVNPTDGTLTPLSPVSFVSNGAGSQPDQLAINTSGPFPFGTLLWVTGKAGTVTSYTVDTVKGQLTNNGSIPGFAAPFGITLHPSKTLAVLYVSETSSPGDIQPMSYTSTGVLSTAGFAPVHSTDASASKPAAIAIDSGGASLFIADQVLGEVSSFSIDGTGSLTPFSPTFANASPSTSDVPVGVGIAVNTGIEYLFTANQGGNSVSSFQTTGTTLTVPPTTASPYSGPTGLVVDPQNAFVYTANNGDGTVGQSAIKGSCGSNICVGPTVATEKPPNAGSGPFGITLAQ